VSCPEDIVGALIDLYLPGGVRPELQAKLVAFMAEAIPPAPPSLAACARPSTPS